MAHWTQIVIVTLALAAAATAVTAAGPLVVEQHDAGRTWPRFPSPDVLYLTAATQPSPDGRIFEQTLAGLLAYEARVNGGGPMFWITDDDPAARRSLDMFRARRRPRVERVAGDAWDLLARMTKEQRLDGYVVYRRDRSDVKDPAKDMSLNIAISLCAPLKAVAVEEAMQDRARAAGLKMIADARDKDHAWLMREHGDRLSREFVALQDPRRDHHMRDLAVACGAAVVSSGPGGGFDLALAHARPGGTVFGWDSYEEYAFVVKASRYGLVVQPADWLLNAPITMSGEPAPEHSTRAPTPTPTPRRAPRWRAMTTSQNTTSPSCQATATTSAGRPAT
jgi:hypothetical protein